MTVTSNEGEVESHKLDYPCQDLEIKREPTVLFNPQQSRIAEKKSRDVTFHNYKESSRNSYMEVQESSVHESSRSNKHREEAREPLVDPIKKPIKRL